MRHINAESALPQERSAGTSREEEQEEEEEAEEPLPWRRHRGVLMGCSPPELACQKVYQVSIFSPPAGCSPPPEQRAPGRQPVKRPCPEPQRGTEGAEWDPKRGRWEEGDDDIEDGLLVDELSLGGTAQHFSHSGLRVVEHRPENSPPRARGGAAAQAPHAPCDTLHTAKRGCAPASPDPGPAGGQEENGGPRDQGPPDPHRLPGPGLHNLAHQPQLGDAPLAAPGGRLEPGTPPADRGSEANGLDSAEKTPHPASRLLGGGAACCPAKRKLLPSSAEGAAEAGGSEDEGRPPARKKKKRTPACPPVPASCRSTDAKGAPFWNHLLAKGSVPSGPAGCQLKAGLRLKQRHLRSSLPRSPTGCRPPSATPWATTSTSRALLGNFEESILKGRFPPSGQIEGFTAEIGASGSYCPQHATLPVEVTYFDIAEHSAPSPFLGVIDLESLGKKGYSIPKTGTIQVTLFNPNKTVVKMFLVTYDFHDMPANHITFLRHRIFLVPVGEEEEEEQGPGPAQSEVPRRVLCYLMHLRFHSSKSGKIYLHDNIRLLFSRKSIEIDSGIPYELKSFTELPRNPCYSPRA